jgi:polyhydroxyalkanoate synthesis repressor PhaR
MTEKRVIKKYPNRRLYDTAESKYITLEDVRKLVLDGVAFCVTDKKTDEDITRNILLQIIIEQEEDGEPIFSTDALTQLIGYYGDSVRGMASTFLERSLGMFTEQQQALQQHLNEAVRNSPLTTITELTQRNLALWQRMQEDFFKAAGMSTRSRSAESGEPEPEDK